MTPGLQIRLSQQLRLTPQLLQSIRLLGLSTVELEQEIEGAVQENPMLEREDDPLASHLRLAPSGAVLDHGTGPGEGASRASEDGDGDGASGGESGTDSAARDAEMPLDAGDWSRAGSGSHQGEDDSGEGQRDWASSAPGLEEHLISQLSSTAATERDRALVGLLISELDDHGYLLASLEELRGLIEEFESIDEGELETALRLLQSFDPPGVGARTAAECIRIQIDQLLAVSAPADRAQLDLARAIASEHIELLAARDYVRLRRALGVEDDLLRAAIVRIVSLNPFPGSAFGGASPAYIVPDILVRKRRSRWVAEINPEVRPRVRIHRDFADFVQRGGRRRRPGAVAGADAPSATPAASGVPAPGNAVAATDWPAKVRDASQFLRNLDDRFETIRRVAQAVVDRQNGFFSHGAIAMRPLVRREIASLLELNESTVSRATANKFMATPFGVFELRYFFASHVATDSGGEASSTAIRELITQLVDAEDPAAPLSDGQIQQKLVAQGMVVARRTVAKYREQMKIVPANLRRKL